MIYFGKIDTTYLDKFNEKEAHILDYSKWSERIKKFPLIVWKEFEDNFSKSFINNYLSEDERISDINLRAIENIDSFIL